jgi:hypothetical protein
MIENVFHPRIIENKDWAILLFVLALLLIALSKSIFESRFNDFVNLIFTDKYIKIYKDSAHLISGFSVFLFVVQLISYSFFIQLTLHCFGLASKSDWIVFVQIITFLVFFIVSKYLIELIIATSFQIEEFVKQYNLYKLSYRSYIGLLLLPLDIVLFYNETLSRTLFISIIIVLLVTNALTYLLSLKNYQNLLFSKLFYFILYLCTLEIAPYYFMYYWFTKKLAH